MIIYKRDKRPLKIKCVYLKCPPACLGQDGGWWSSDGLFSLSGLAWSLCRVSPCCHKWLWYGQNFSHSEVLTLQQLPWKELKEHDCLDVWWLLVQKFDLGKLLFLQKKNCQEEFSELVASRLCLDEEDQEVYWPSKESNNFNQSCILYVLRMII